jgi:hypothetical protein
MLRGFVLFGDDFAYLGIFAPIASARHSCPILSMAVGSLGAVLILARVWAGGRKNNHRAKRKALAARARKLFSLSLSGAVAFAHHVPAKSVAGRPFRLRVLKTN